MPDQIITIGDRQFRKRGYWRAIAVAFNLTIEPLQESRAIHGAFADGRENFGWLVTYRATAPNGRAAIGDGSCFAVEKAARFRCPHPEPGRATDGALSAETCPAFDPAHVWRRSLRRQASTCSSHATRAYNRAVPTVGFAETPVKDQDGDDARTPRSSPRAGTPAAALRFKTAPIAPIRRAVCRPRSTPQQRRLWERPARRVP
jgi:hypothetical protein